MSASGPGCVETRADFLCDARVGLNGLPRRVFRFWGFVRLMRAYGPDFAVLFGDLADYGRNLERRRRLCSDRCDQRGDAHDVHDAFEIVGQHVQGHFGADPFQRPHLEVR